MKTLQNIPCQDAYEEEHEEPCWFEGLGGHEVDDQDVDQGKDQLKINYLSKQTTQ